MTDPVNAPATASGLGAHDLAGATASPPFVLGTGPDPTAVMGRRVGAYVLDGLLVVLLTLLAVLATGGLSERRGLSGCDAVDGSICLQAGDSVFVAEGAPELAVFLVPLAYAVIFSVIVQGRSGATPGKAAFGVRVVDPEGRGPGVGRALVRTLLLPVDMIGCLLPLVGLVTALSSRGHRRVGDMVAHTFVVDRSAVGRAIVMPTVTAALPPAPPRSPPTEPQWDPARGTYVVWDPSRGRWLAYDQSVGLWREL